MSVPLFSATFKRNQRFKRRKAQSQGTGCKPDSVFPVPDCRGTREAAIHLKASSPKPFCDPPGSRLWRRHNGFLFDLAPRRVWLISLRQTFPPSDMLSVPLVLILRWEGVALCGAAGVRTFLPEKALSSGLTEETGPILTATSGRRARLSSLNLTQKQADGKQKAKNLLQKTAAGSFFERIFEKKLEKSQKIKYFTKKPASAAPF